MHSSEGYRESSMFTRRGGAQGREMKAQREESKGKEGEVEGEEGASVAWSRGPPLPPAERRRGEGDATSIIEWLVKRNKTVSHDHATI